MVSTSSSRRYICQSHVYLVSHHEQRRLQKASLRNVEGVPILTPSPCTLSKTSEMLRTSALGETPASDISSAQHPSSSVFTKFTDSEIMPSISINKRQMQVLSPPGARPRSRPERST